MKESYWGYWIIILGIFIIGVMLLVNSTTTNSTQDYYAIKEVTQAAMVDAVDFAYYRLYGNVKMSEQKFVENFLRRFAENSNLSNTYKVEFFDLYEVPPKVSVRVSTNTGDYNVGHEVTSFDVVNTLDAILEWGVEKTPCTGSNCYNPCLIDVNMSLTEALNSNRDGIRDKYPYLNQVYNRWKELDPNFECEWSRCQPLKQAFEDVFGNGLSGTTGEDLVKGPYGDTFAYLKEKGYITYLR